MGVDIKDILVRHVTNFQELRGRMAIDAYNTLYQFLTIIRQPDGTPLLDSKGRVTSHITGLFYRTCGFIEKGVKPVYVFDGEPPLLKKKAIEERVKRKAEAETQWKQAVEEGRAEDAARLVQRTVRLTPQFVEESKKLLDMLGVPWVQAPSEGEAQCAAMCAAGQAIATGSQDLDSLLFGSPVLVRNLATAGRRKLPRKNAYVDVSPEKIDLQENLSALGITREKLVWIGLLCGTDYNEGVRGIGAKKGLKLVQKHDSLDAITKELKIDADFAEVEQAFLHPRVKKVGEGEIAARAPDREKVIGFMAGEHDFSTERVENALARAFKEPVDSDQEKLGKWF
ncbi:MAG: flap endonuclease-1 [Candidatus Micrarchaeota archaeon]|nr:flap endonuclease-1 [Candidatus Micrarchaeota archaeon]